MVPLCWPRIFYFTCHPIPVLLGRPDVLCSRSPKLGMLEPDQVG
jgi:hypothetical protein